MPRPTIGAFRLYLVTDPRLCRGRTVLEQVRLALEGGVRLVQLRDKGLDTDEFVSLAVAARRQTAACRGWLLVNDRLDVAVAAGADGVHLGQDDASPVEARRLLGSRALIGVSVSSPDEARRAESDGADYLAVNGVFTTATKAFAGVLPGLAGVSAIRAATRLPLLGIGGIHAGNCGEVISAGADGVAVVTAITMADDIPVACRELLAAVETALARRG